jgi:hypothetical protein
VWHDDDEEKYAVKPESNSFGIYGARPCERKCFFSSSFILFLFDEYAGA